MAHEPHTRRGEWPARVHAVLATQTTIACAGGTATTGPEKWCETTADFGACSNVSFHGQCTNVDTDNNINTPTELQCYLLPGWVLLLNEGACGKDCATPSNCVDTDTSSEPIGCTENQCTNNKCSFVPNDQECDPVGPCDVGKCDPLHGCIQVPVPNGTQCETNGSCWGGACVTL